MQLQFSACVSCWFLIYLSWSRGLIFIFLAQIFSLVNIPPLYQEIKNYLFQINFRASLSLPARDIDIIRFKWYQLELIEEMHVCLSEGADNG